MGGTAIIFTIALCGLSAAVPTTKDSKIIGGVETTIEDVPYLLQMEKLKSDWSFACGGNIIGDDIVVTAGHCVDGQNATTMRFRSGNKNRGEGTVHSVEQFVLHPNYTIVYVGLRYADYDIAVLKVSPPFKFSSTTQKIELVEKAPSAGDNGTFSGWGTTSEGASELPTIVRKVDVPVVDFGTCQADYHGRAILTQRMLCAGFEEGGKDHCSGDSGGPFVIDRKLAGLVSWAFGCAERGYPGVATNVIEFLPWIKETVAGFSKKY